MDAKAPTAHATVANADDLYSVYRLSTPSTATTFCLLNPQTCTALTRAYGRFGTPSAPALRRIHAAAGG